MLKRILLGIGVVVVLTVGGCFLWLNYGNSVSAASLEARVVDATTYRRIEGAMVVATWAKSAATLGGKTIPGNVEVREAVTDKDGLFRFDAWGPKRVGGLCEGDTRRWPQLVVFRPGYVPVRLMNRDNYIPGRRQSDYDGAMIRLERFQGGDKEWQGQLDRLDGFLWDVYTRPCEWEATPRMIAAYLKEGEALAARGRVGVMTLAGFEEWKGKKGCRSAAALLKEYLQ